MVDYFGINAPERVTGDNMYRTHTEKNVFSFHRLQYGELYLLTARRDWGINWMMSLLHDESFAELFCNCNINTCKRSVIVYHTKYDT